MRFYQATRFLFPSSLRLRMFAICFIGTHIPLLSFAGWQFVRDKTDWSDLGIVLGATLIGTVFTLLGIDALLAPVRAATRAVQSLEREQAEALESVKDGDMLAELLIGVTRASEATKVRIAALDMAAHRDPLTGLLNRRGFLVRAEAAGDGSIALLDLDRFKSINDQFGHDAGDEILQDFAAFLARGVRRTDCVGRWGGEEFAVLFPDTDEGEAAAVLRRLARRLANGLIERPDGIPVTCSGGVVAIEGEPMPLAMARADAALYAAKRSGRNQLRVGDAHALVE
ncbi:MULTISPECIES: diguanylate cyclase [unclassified Sphingomonas]|uniref:GGDEF domain-containing protein n=1 Tax=unclassified Sphingomonas TaxID=196159 RepID=UPI0021512805|nr:MULTISPECIES: GGDEF domain-containing protein [unclassified Sphingomonas]MCR5872193.1 GGDEF domain-containing protein [Sphingomonas sp. J344]UUX99494.1 GGDEF domain-containing protein [Sphingomonas sp. J315]